MFPVLFYETFVLLSFLLVVNPKSDNLMLILLIFLTNDWFSLISSKAETKIFPYLISLWIYPYLWKLYSIPAIFINIYLNFSSERDLSGK